MAELVGQVKSLGLSHVQLGLQELLFLDDKRKHQELGHLRDSGIQLTSTMISFPGENYASIATIVAFPLRSSNTILSKLSRLV